jgi:hypothetical protein
MSKAVAPQTDDLYRMDVLLPRQVAYRLMAISYNRANVEPAPQAELDELVAERERLLARLEEINVLLTPTYR